MAPFLLFIFVPIILLFLFAIAMITFFIYIEKSIS